MSATMRLKLLLTGLRWLTVVVVLRVLVLILANYSDYIPPNFDSLFLQGREATFGGWYSWAFYVHIATAPFVLVNGFVLLSERVRRWSRKLHRYLGRVQVIVLLCFMLPSSIVMARHAFAGWPAGFSFLLLSLTTGFCAVRGTLLARQRRFAEHRVWMSRCLVLLCSAVVLRLVSGAASEVHVTHEEGAYIVAAWSSWLGPLTVYEVVRRRRNLMERTPNSNAPSR